MFKYFKRRRARTAVMQLAKEAMEAGVAIPAILTVATGSGILSRNLLITGYTKDESRVCIDYAERPCDVIESGSRAMDIMAVMTCHRVNEPHPPRNWHNFIAVAKKSMLYDLRRLFYTDVNGKKYYLQTHSNVQSATFLVHTTWDDRGVEKQTMGTVRRELLPFYTGTFHLDSDLEAIPNFTYYAWMAGNVSKHLKPAIHITPQSELVKVDVDIADLYSKLGELLKKRTKLHSVISTRSTDTDHPVDLTSLTTAARMSTYPDFSGGSSQDTSSSSESST